MADQIELVGATIGGATIGGLLLKLIQGLGSRSISALDKTLEHLDASIRTQGAEMKQLIGELTREIRALRDTDIAQAKDIGALQQAFSGLEKRVDGQSAHYREQLDAHRQLIFDRLTETVESIAKGRKR